jgi:hypothetical protein
MSAAGIFTLITNDGKQDRMLMATDLLRKRLQAITDMRKAKGQSPTPTLVDIEKTHILFMNAHFKPFVAIGYEYNKVLPEAGTTTLGNTVHFSIPQFGDFFHDMVLHIKLSDPTPTGGTTPTYRWCQYPGERLMRKVAFSVNGNPLDEYHADDYAFYRKMQVPSHKKTGYARCVGQEVGTTAEFFQATGDAPTNSRICGVYKNGFQTPRTGSSPHGALEMFIPLLFWFCGDPRLAIPSVAIPFGQRKIDVTFEEQNRLVGQEVRGTAVAGTLGSVTVQKCELYINNIFVNPEVHDIFISRIGFSLIRVHKRQMTNLDTADASVRLPNLKYPVETMFVGFRPTGNGTVTNTDYAGSGTGLNHLDHWHYYSRVTRAAVTGNPLSAYVDTQVDPIDTMTVKAHGIKIYDEFPARFYNSYMPLRYGDNSISTPDDKGVYMVSFCLYPGTYQPSGHINVSRAREFYIDYVSSTLTTPISAANPAQLVMSASCLNFIVYSDGSAVLRYST